MNGYPLNILLIINIWWARKLKLARLRFSQFLLGQYPTFFRRVPSVWSTLAFHNRGMGNFDWCQSGHWSACCADCRRCHQCAIYFHLLRTVNCILFIGMSTAVAI